MTEGGPSLIRHKHQEEGKNEKNRLQGKYKYNLKNTKRKSENCQKTLENAHLARCIARTAVTIVNFQYMCKRLWKHQEVSILQNARKKTHRFFQSTIGFGLVFTTAMKPTIC